MVGPIFFNIDWQGHFESDGRSVKLLTKLYRNYWHTPQVMLTVMFALFQDTNLRGLFEMWVLIQPSCVPLSLGYRTAHVPGCPQDVNSQLHYQPANYCSCRLQHTPHCVNTRFLMTHAQWPCVKSQTSPLWDPDNMLTKAMHMQGKLNSFPVVAVVCISAVQLLIVFSIRQWIGTKHCWTAL